MLTLDYESRVKAIVKAIDPDKLPIVIELAGMPRVGKTEFTDAFIDLARRSGCKAVAYVQGEYNCPIIDRWSVDFSTWGIITFIRRFFEFKQSGQQIIIADRGLFDATVWLRLKVEDERCDQITYVLLRQLAMSDPWWSHQSMVLVFNAPIEEALSRARERRLYREESFVTNEQILHRLKKAYLEEGNSINDQQRDLIRKSPIIRYLNTDGKNLTTVLHEAAETVISSLEEKCL